MIRSGCELFLFSFYFILKDIKKLYNDHLKPTDLIIIKSNLFLKEKKNYKMIEKSILIFLSSVDYNSLFFEKRKRRILLVGGPVT